MLLLKNMELYLKPYLVVPIVGAFLIDLIGVIVIMGFIQWFS
ncbi:hypothetical protein ACV566_06355 [Staphylococcus aureus]